MRFTWDPAKARRNQRIHGVSFEVAAEIFDDPNHLAGDNYFIEEAREQRMQIIGMTRGLVLLLVVFVERESDEIRIVSARKAVDYEKSIYHDQFS
jgi:hypothetical protein